MTRVILSDSGMWKGDMVESLRKMEEREEKKDVRFGVSVRRRGPSSSSDDEDGDEESSNETGRAAENEVAFALREAKEVQYKVR